MQSEAVKVVFKVTPWDECIAFILDDLSSFPNYTCYMHVGQHGEASPAFFDECREATVEEWQDLYNELREIGYSPIIKNSVASWGGGEADRTPWLKRHITDQEMVLPYNES
mgnify:CR=1 FL=1